MFKNPLKKYQQGGAAPTQEEQQVLAAFIEWLPKRVKEFEGMQPEAIAQALDGMTKTPEGQKQVQQLMEQFQQEMQSAQAFRQGGKIHDFICKHSKGGHVAGCGCKENGGSVEKAQEGLPKIGGTFKSADGQITIRNFGTADADTLGTYSYPTTNGEFRFNKNGRTATVWDNTGGWADHFYADPNWIRRHPRRQLLPKGLGGNKDVAPEGFFENLVQRVNNRVPQQQEGGKVVYTDRTWNDPNFSLTLAEEWPKDKENQIDSTFTFIPKNGSREYVSRKHLGNGTVKYFPEDGVEMFEKLRDMWKTHEKE